MLASCIISGIATQATRGSKMDRYNVTVTGTHKNGSRINAGVIDSGAREDMERLAAYLRANPEQLSMIRVERIEVELDV
jgi:hypothetical protein